RVIAACAAALACVLAQSAAAAAGDGPAPQPAKATDPRRYAGRWYEIARLPNKLEADCQAPTSDWAKQTDGSFSVVQTCRQGSPSGPAKIWRAAGRIIDGSNNSKIRVGFFGGFIHQDYWIIDHADDYSWCLMSTPSSRWLWIMARSPKVSPALKAALVARARSLGYDIARLIYDQQPPA
ncbi:MAG TPA: lipocalin family protein, partial [Caulobacteraceae bacterium]|nr:lipocalin family protein [Caulobacteraceae bacterium]